jgi:hypothetical protein
MIVTFFCDTQHPGVNAKALFSLIFDLGAAEDAEGWAAAHRQRVIADVQGEDIRLDDNSRDLRVEVILSTL